MSRACSSGGGGGGRSLNLLLYTCSINFVPRVGWLVDLKL